MTLLTKILTITICAILMIALLKQHDTYKEPFTGIFDNVKHHIHKHKRNLRHMIKDNQKKRSDKNHANFNSKPLHLKLLGMVGL